MAGVRVAVLRDAMLRMAPQSVRMFRSRLENFVCDGLEDVDREVFRLSGCQNDGDLA
jgi:hypothetical protein